MYNATVVRLGEPREHPNADRLQIFSILGYQVITSLEYNEGDLGLFFPPDGQVSEKFAAVNDLIERRDKDGNRAGGYMSHKRRIRAINLRGQKSQGLWLPMSSLSFLLKDVSFSGDLMEGQEMNSFQGHEFCNKYFTPATQAARVKGPKTRKETVMFRRHLDTKKLQQRIDYVPYGYPFVITEKVHGTSGRYGRVLDSIPYPKYHWKRWLGKERKEWVYLSGSRNVIHRTYEQLQQGFYEDNSFRQRVIRPLQGYLHKGETVFFEIVGWESEDRPIMDAVNTKILRDKSIVNTYGETMYYKYGVPNGDCKMLVYRITMTNEDGVSYDLSWPQVKQRCGELGVEYVREIVSGYNTNIWDLEQLIPVGDRMSFNRPVDTIAEGMRESLLTLCEKHSTGPSYYDHTHMREGVVLRVDTGELVPEIYKYKSHEFLVLEGHTKDREDYIDLEEIS